MAAEAKSVKPVELGFIENVPRWKLRSHCFPSKVGGKPAWLDLKDLPQPEQLTCGICGKMCIFLLQVYAPIDDKEFCFHRSIFLFACQDPLCYQQNDNRCFVVLRSQQGRKNEFYDYEPPNLDYFDPSIEYPLVDSFTQLCIVCGSAGSKRCGACHKATYCTKDHQAVDWRSHHKQICKNLVSDDLTGKAKSTPASDVLLFPEFEIVIEPEVSNGHVEKNGEHAQDTEASIKEYEAYVAKHGTGTLDDDRNASTDLESMALHESRADKQFLTFKKRVSLDPEQVLRYNRNQEPLWISAEPNSKPTEVPSCPCGAQRTFEFQVMPQLLLHLKVDSLESSIDWGTLIVYTCSNSCNQGSTYHPEFLWKQDCSEQSKT